MEFNFSLQVFLSLFKTPELDVLDAILSKTAFQLYLFSERGQMKLEHKIFVITGGTRGIGRAIVETFAREGAQVLFTYLNNDVLAKEIESNLKKAKLKAQGFKLDVKDHPLVDQWKEKILDEYGNVDILINNAGITRDKALALMSKDEWDEVIDTNLNCFFM